ncbi:MAG: Transposase [Bryobacterales bacterium]|nr:Transposase [Bryobacterales bacterium]
MLTRLTAALAQRLAGGAVPDVGSDLSVVWEPSEHDRRTNRGFSAEACMQGRLIAVMPAGAKQILYLFTTLEEPAHQVAALYRQCWTVETDLRSLKEQVRLHQIDAKSPTMVASELFLAVATCFSRARAALLAFAQASAHQSPGQKDHGWQLVLQSIAQCKLPQRKRLSPPRLVWPRPQTFPTHKVSDHA